MEVTRKQRVLAGALGLALFGLFADRFMPGPSGAEAALIPDATLIEPMPEPTDAEPPRLTVFARALEGALQSQPAQAAGAARDAFTWDQWATLPVAPSIAPDPGADFLASHDLTSVINGRPAAAVVDGRLVRVGQELDGFTLIGVGLRSAEFMLDGTRVTLALPDDH